MKKLFQLKNIPNILGVLRIILCIPIIVLSFTPTSYAWTAVMVCFILAGITDMIDGPLARRIKDGKSELGAKIDSIADMALVISAIIFIMPKMVSLNWGSWFEGKLWGWLFIVYISVMLFRVVSDNIGKIKFKETVMLHTYGMKLLAILLWSLPIVYWVFIVLASLGTAAILAVNIYALAVIVFAFICICEEIAINVFLLRPARNIKSIFDVKKENNQTRKELQDTQTK